MLTPRFQMPKTTIQPGALQRGYLLIEALVSILIFSTGILAIFSLQAASIQNSADAKYRADASFLANQIIGYMWGDRANLAAYQHRPGGVACAPTGDASSNTNVTSWLAEVNTTLPNAAATRHQITVNTATGAVTVTLCWSTPQSPANRSYTAMAQING